MKRKRKERSVFCKGKIFDHAGTHLLIEMWNVKDISSPENVKKILKGAARACGASLLELHAHLFSPFQGISGIAILKESHIAIHTWPEFGYAAADIFTCGNSVQPERAVEVLLKGLNSTNHSMVEMRRGIFAQSGVLDECHG